MGSAARHRSVFATTALAPVVAVVLVLAGCASAPPQSSGGPGDATSRSGPFATDRDGPGANPPPDLARVPDAEPRLEPIRAGGPNKPYELLGKRYVPITQDAAFTERGLASWYGRKFHGRPTASGEVYNMYAMTAAHPTLPIPSYARIRNPANGREVLVRVNDRGPFHPGRIVDLSYTAALRLDVLRGVAPVELQRITFDDIRTGAWRREGSAEVVATAAANAPAGASVGVPAELVAPVVAVPADVRPSMPTELPAPVVARVDTGASMGAGTAGIADAPAARAFTTPARGFWVQLGAFKAREGAEQFQQRVGAEMDWLAPLLAVFGDASVYRLQAGPYPSRDEARLVAERVRGGLKLVPVIVERR